KDRIAVMTGEPGVPNEERTECARHGERDGSQSDPKKRTSLVRKVDAGAGDDVCARRTGAVRRDVIDRRLNARRVVSVLVHVVDSPRMCGAFVSSVSS